MEILCRQMQARSPIYIYIYIYLDSISFEGNRYVVHASFTEMMESPWSSG